MGGCCDDGCSEELQRRQRGTLTAVFLINAVMFLVILAGALYGDSAALLTDSLDNLGDALTYGLSFYVVGKSRRAKARVALFKGGLILLAALAVGTQIVAKLLTPVLPLFETMGAFSLLGLGANLVCLFLLWRHREDDLNMSSVWECSRNDIASNLSVFAAAGAVWWTQASWPDLLVATVLMLFLLRSSIRVLRKALGQLRGLE